MKTVIPGRHGLVLRDFEDAPGPQVQELLASSLLANHPGAGDGMGWLRRHCKNPRSRWDLKITIEFTGRTPVLRRASARLAGK